MRVFSWCYCTIHFESAYNIVWLRIAVSSNMSVSLNIYLVHNHTGLHIDFMICNKIFLSVLPTNMKHLLLFIFFNFQALGKDIVIPEATFSYPGSCYPVNCWRFYNLKYLVPMKDGQTECSDRIDVENVKVQGYEHNWKNICAAPVRIVIYS